ARMQCENPHILRTTLSLDVRKAREGEFIQQVAERAPDRGFEIMVARHAELIPEALPVGALVVSKRRMPDEYHQQQPRVALDDFAAVHVALPELPYRDSELALCFADLVLSEVRFDDQADGLHPLSPLVVRVAQPVRQGH